MMVSFYYYHYNNCYNYYYNFVADGNVDYIDMLMVVMVNDVEPVVVVYCFGVYR